MSYDLILLPCPPDLAGGDAVDWFEQYEEPDGDEGLSSQALAAWDRIVADAQPLRVDSEVEASDEHAELTWPDDGLMLEFWPDEATISLAYWHDGASAQALVGFAYRLATLVASHTGLRAFDPQLEVLLDEAQPDAAAEEYARGRALRS